MNPDPRLCLHELFERQVRRTPDAPAVIDAGTELTYAALDRRSERLADRLRELGLGPDRVAGIYMDRCAEYVIAMLAALKAGGAFLPLEPAYPESLLGQVLEDSRPVAIISRGHFARRLPEGERILHPDTGREGDGGTGGSPPPSPENLAFVSYSSGTTGRPKGIANPHRAAVGSYLWRFREISDNRPGDRVGCNVFFIWEALRPLLRGAATVAIPDDVIYDPPALVRFLEEYRITETLMTPSLLEAVLNACGAEVTRRLAGLRTLWLNGEVVTRALARRALALLPETRLLNVYSISETHEVAAGDLRKLAEAGSTYCPVGRPLDPDRTYILDEDRNPVPDGEPGELWVGGRCLAREYVNRPEITAERFVPDPFAGEGRMYRTGDRARRLPDGALEILGRVDFMVKIRGYSVELGAVESAIEELLAVEGCVVVAEGGEGEDKRLVAYLLPASGEERAGRHSGWEIDTAGRSPEIRRILQERLPHYMIPAVYVELEELPLQETSGKVNRRRLPPPPPRTNPAPGVPERLSAAASRREREAALARIWEEVIGLEPGDVRPADNFFDVGGHSLAAAEMLTRVEGASSVRISMPRFLAHPTVAGLCDALEGREPRRPQRRPDLRSEGRLEPEIAPEGPAGDLSLRDARSILLTGATGYLGAFLLDALLRETRAEIRCLVRPREGSPPLAPLRENLARYGLWSPEAAQRITPVPGDLSNPRLGLPEEEFDALARGTDLILHAAARVNLVYPYPELKPANVDGTREVLRLACRHRAKPLHYVSTNGIFPAGTGRCREDADLPALAGTQEDGYGQTKWVSEMLVRQARERGLPANVYRPGNISGHSESGSSNPRDFLTALIAESIRMGRAPVAEDWRVEMTPVDFVSDAIVRLAGDPETAGGTFHLANPAPPLAREVFGWIRNLGYPVEPLSYPDWLKEWRDRGGGGGVLRGVLHGAETRKLWDGNFYDDTNTRRALRSGGPQHPGLGPGIVENYVEHFAEEGWIQKPARV
jgi:amino acid adenylation domain-containing protein/thioester reductase-like protein